MSNSLRIGIFPAPYLTDKWNNECNQNLKYWADSIKVHGYEVVGVSLENLINLDELKNLHLDLLHFHWPDSLLGKHVGRAADIKILMLIKYKFIKNNLNIWLKEFEQLGIPLVLQIHDLFCHQYVEKSQMHNLDLYFRRALYNLSCAVLTQEHSSLPVIEKFYGKKLFGVTYLGDFQAFHGEKIDRSVARKLLNIDQEKKVFLCMGTARPNRNPKRAIEVFNNVDNDDVLLIVAGMNTENFKKFSHGKNVVFYSGILENQIIRNLICASDFMISDGADYLTSAVLRCSMSYGVPVITVKYGSAIDMTAGAAIYIQNQEDGLKDSITTAIQLSEQQYSDLVMNAIMRNSERSWEQCGEVCHHFYGKFATK